MRRHWDRLPLVVDDGADGGTDYCAQPQVRRRLRVIGLLDDHRALHVIRALDDDRARLLDRIAEFNTGPAVTPPLDTIARAAALLKDTGAPFSAVIVIAAEPVDASALVRGELLPQIIESGAAVQVD